MQNIYKNLYQFTSYILPMDFTIHQYLLASDPAIVFATGTKREAEKNLLEIKKILNGRPVKYIFISHLESDECGGLSVFLEEFPKATVLCSSLCARELPGFGYTGKIKIGQQGENLQDGDLHLQFFDYPSKVHLQNGLVCFEQNSGVFYSADLMSRYGDGRGKCIEGHWKTEVTKIGLERVPNKNLLSKLKERLLTIQPKLNAVGHGVCVAFSEAESNRHGRSPQ